MVSGIVNIKGSCYINTVLQLLFNDTHFVKLLESRSRCTLLNKLRLLYHDRSIENTKKFIDECCTQLGEYMDFRMQNDIHEFMILLLDHMNKELGPVFECVKTTRSFMEYLQNEWVKHHPDGLSQIADIFHGQTITQIKCPTCQEIYHNAEVFTTLALDIDGNVIIDLIQNYLKGDKIEDWKCDKCKTCHGIVSRTIALTRTPDTLIITLKRFKSNKNIVFDNNLTLNVFKNRKRHYKLQAIGCHVGCSASGHYFANVKDSDDKWITIDDECVSHANISNLESSGYLLMYSAQN